jgi:hypothetical protein
MNVTSNSFDEAMRRLIREEVVPIIREEVRPIIREEVRPIIREETQDIRDDLQEVKVVLGTHSLQLKSLQAGMNIANNTLRGHSQEIHRLDVLLEDLQERLAIARELRWD